MDTATQVRRERFLVEVADALLRRRMGYLAPSANDMARHGAFDDARAVLERLVSVGLVDADLVGEAAPR